ncbi:MAG: BTAD domain-containing putative transcriptional regulator, partial [Streptosporangiaceae bacterium]
MGSDMEFCLLGPLLVRSGPVVVAPPGKQRAVLAALLLNVGRVVSVDELTDTLWGHNPPPSARVTTQNHVMRLRKTLGHPAGSRVSTQPPGYQIRVDDGELDITRFEAHLAAARVAARASAWETAAAQARAGLALWRGEPLADVESEALARRELPRLGELRLLAVETRIDADLHLGRHGEVIAELRQLAITEPLREQLHALLMLALYRDGRLADALAAYQRARDVLVTELGVEPGPRLRRLHQQVLAADPELTATAPAARIVNNSERTVPRQLPACVPHFAGRAKELAALNRLLDQNGTQAVVISAIGGTAGVGKTALAIHWAHQVVQRFPDGQLYVNLRGYDPGQPMPAADALAGFLGALGIAGDDMPRGLDERSALYRSLLADRRMLVVADNAGSVQQVRPLLPGTPGCVAVVTSRDSLAGLVARDGAQRLDLDLLPSGDAVALLRTLIGERVDAEPRAAVTLADYCSRLPLALRVAAEFAVTRSAISLANLVGDLANQQRRLDLLEVDGDPGTAVRAVFSWSYRRLDASTARAFRLLGLHPGLELDSYTAAALTGTTVEAAHQIVGQLARAHLIHPAGPGMHGMHDLLRAYARELADLEDQQEWQAALTRLFDHYLYTAASAMDALFPAEHRRRPRLSRSAWLDRPMTGPPAARAWLDAQQANLVPGVAFSADQGWPD